jgi:hypothetical protein
MSDAKTTQDHDTIRAWAQARGGKPATVSGTGDGEAGILRLDFDPKDEKLDTITWGEFFEKFDEADLAFLYQEETADGKKSRFHKFISAEKQ